MLTTHGGRDAKAASLFVNEVLAGADTDVELIDRATSWEIPPQTDGDADPALALARRVVALPTKRERRLALRLRATELVGLLEGTNGTDPERRRPGRPRGGAGRGGGASGPRSG